LRTLSISANIRTVLTNIRNKLESSITSKVMSLYSIFRVYGLYGGLNLIKACLIGGQARIGSIILNDSASVEKAVWLSKLIVRGLLQYGGDKLVVSIDGNVHEYTIQHVITDKDSFRKMLSLALFRRYFEFLEMYGAQCKKR